MGQVYENGKRLSVREVMAKLTPKQRKFAEGLVLGGLSKAEAYRQAYNWRGSSDKALRNNASKLAQHNGVSMAIRAIEEERVARIWENKDVFRNWIMKGITDTANNTESDITRLKALELAGKTRYASLYEEPAANESTSALNATLAATLAARLECLLGVAPPMLGEQNNEPPTIDAHAEPIQGDTPTPTGGGEGE